MVDRGKLDIDKDLSYVDPRILSQASSDRIELPADYTPGYWDVICQGGKENYDHSESSHLSIYLVVCVLLLSYDSALSMYYYCLIALKSVTEGLE